MSVAKPDAVIIGRSSVIEPKPIADFKITPELSNLIARSSLPVSPNQYIVMSNESANHITTGNVGKVDFAQTTDRRTMVFCSPSDEFINSRQRGQDAAALIILGKSGRLGVFVDGKGGSWLGQEAATEAVVAIATNPQSVLESNLINAALAIQERHNTIVHSNAESRIIRDAQNQLRKTEGTSTLIGQISVNDATGEVDGSFLIDGMVSIYDKAKGTWQHFLTGTNPAKMSLKSAANKGIVGEPKTLDDIVGRKVTLKSGDIIIACTDGGRQIDKQTHQPFYKLVGELAVKSSDPQTVIAQLLEQANTRTAAQYPDDTTFFIHKQ